jgi:hypothetical protein
LAGAGNARTRVLSPLPHHTLVPAIASFKFFLCHRAKLALLSAGALTLLSYINFQTQLKLK